MTKWSLVVLFGAGCGGTPTDDTADTGGAPVSVEAGLPDGVWAGTVSDTCDDGSGERSLTYGVEIVDDVLIREFDDGEFNGVSQDTFVYTDPGDADWMGLDGAPIGACEAAGGVFHCATFETQKVQEDRTLTFTEGRLRWEASVSLAGTTCVATGSLPETE